jgi:hypothetical protein
VNRIHFLISSSLESTVSSIVVESFLDLKHRIVTFRDALGTGRRMCERPEQSPCLRSYCILVVL